MRSGGLTSRGAAAAAAASVIGRRRRRLGEQSEVLPSVVPGRWGLGVDVVALGVCLPQLHLEVKAKTVTCEREKIFERAY